MLKAPRLAEQNFSHRGKCNLLLRMNLPFIQNVKNITLSLKFELVFLFGKNRFLEKTIIGFGLMSHQNLLKITFFFQGEKKKKKKYVPNFYFLIVPSLNINLSV